MAYRGTLDLIHRKLSWPALAETPLVTTLLLLEMSPCAGLCRISTLAVVLKVKHVLLIPPVLLGRFYGTFNNILNVMGNSRNEMSAL